MAFFVFSMIYTLTSHKRLPCEYVNVFMNRIFINFGLLHFTDRFSPVIFDFGIFFFQYCVSCSMFIMVLPLARSQINIRLSSTYQVIIRILIDELLACVIDEHRKLVSLHSPSSDGSFLYFGTTQWLHII